MDVLIAIRKYTSVITEG